MRSVLVPLLLALAVSGCRSKPHPRKPGKVDQVMNAAKDFAAFAHSADRSAPSGSDSAPPPKVVVLSRQVLGAGGARPRVDLEISLPLATNADDVKAVLEAAARSPDTAGFQVVRVRAFPGSLTHVVGPYGTLVLADDGKGWDGHGTSGRVEHVSKRLGAAMSLSQLKALSAVDRSLAAGAKLDKAEATAAHQTRQGADAVDAAVRQARKAWPAP